MSQPAARLLAALGPPAEPTDTELLARFAHERDAGAFELLVWRHATLVLQVCRAVLRDRHEAEDAAQAVFLALARQARSVGKSGSAAGWLFRVARRVAFRASRRRAPAALPTDEFDALPAPEPAAAPDPDSERVLHEEIARLAEPYRAVVLLCFFEGLTHAEAARRLGVPVGTVAGRMARAKAALGSRLGRRGVSLSLLTPSAVAVSPSFASATTHAAIAFAGGSRLDVPGSVLALAKQELRMTLVKKLSAAGAALAVACGCLAFGLRSSAEPPPPSAPATVPQPALANNAPVPKPPAATVGKTFAVAPIATDLQRRLLGAGPDSGVLVLVDGTKLFKDPQTLDARAFHLPELLKALNGIPVVEGKSVAHFVVHYARGTDPSADGTEIAHAALEGVARRVGFVPTRARSTYHNDEFRFDEFVAALKEEKGAGAREDAAGDERARAYPVRTPLSKVLTQSVGGVVEVLAPADARLDNLFTDEADKSVRAAIGKLQLAKGQRLRFVLNVPERNAPIQGRIRDACKRWAEDAGLESRGWSY
jgi:RNA polymerase sigma factor (sigma-70 family)